MQHVQEGAHKHDHILDLIISHDDDNKMKEVSVSSMLFDHFVISTDVSLQKHSVSNKVISYLKYKSIEEDAFLADLGWSLLQ